MEEGTGSGVGHGQVKGVLGGGERAAGGPGRGRRVGAGDGRVSGEAGGPRRGRGKTSHGPE